MHFLRFSTYGLPMTVCIVIAASLILRPHRTREHIILGLSFALLAVATFTMVCYYMGWWTDSPVLDLVSIASSLLCTAVYLIYVLSVTSPVGLEKKHFLFFIPTLVLVAANLIADLLLGWDGTKHYLADYQLGQIQRIWQNDLEIIKWTFDSSWFRALNFGQGIGVMFYGRMRFRKYLQSLTGFYSNRGGAFMDRERKMVYYVEIMMISMLMMSAMPYFLLMKLPVVMTLMSVMFSFSLCMIGVNGHMIKGNAREFKKLTTPDTEMKQAVETEHSEAKKYIGKVQVGLEKFISEKGYLDPNITLDDLAQKIKTNRYYLSQTLKIVYGESFSTFINKRRIEYAQTLITKNADDEPALKSIAIECGYNNFVNFYRNLVKYTGKNPSEWRRDSRSS